MMNTNEKRDFDFRRLSKKKNPRCRYKKENLIWSVYDITIERQRYLLLGSVFRSKCRHGQKRFDN